VSSTTGNTNVLTWAHTVTTGVGGILLVGVSNRDGSKTVTDVSYGGVPLTRIGFQNGPSNANRMELWYLLHPDAGTANVAVTLSGSQKVVAGAISFDGVDQATPLGPFVSASGNSLLPSLLIVSAPGEVVLDTLVANGDANSATPLLTQQQRWNADTGNGGGEAIGAGSTQAGLISVTSTWTLGGIKPWALGAVTIRPC
jgi:hypothetical protein